MHPRQHAAQAAAHRHAAAGNCSITAALRSHHPPSLYADRAADRAQEAATTRTFVALSVWWPAVRGSNAGGGGSPAGASYGAAGGHRGERRADLERPACEQLVTSFVPPTPHYVLQARLASIAPGGVAPAHAPPPPTAAPAAAAAAAAPPPAAVSTSGGALGDYRQLLGTQLVKAVDTAEAIGGQVLQAMRVLAEGFRREAAVVEAFGACQVGAGCCRSACWLARVVHPRCCSVCALMVHVGAPVLMHCSGWRRSMLLTLPASSQPLLLAKQKPDDASLQQLVQPVGEQMMAAGDLAAGPRRYGCVWGTAARVGGAFGSVPAQLRRPGAT